ncbi:MAG: hypothetical protein RMZ41_003070 [Nostoc sp. DedVER02]|uniref:hypothetical protein n=1 Tax=unclassified Nostoc TaxID=2593658 RepID=UPI002AD22573|nr:MULTISPECIES: hypothetical protein [unclassified Nostoc]MDZ7986863.1 hypothetical protein [Nostoc sp. DedVER02]MDZ8115765.1 hypothetical protein [Nostoc sp. DedVER01b]
MNTKNFVKARLKGKIIEVQITASSEEMADKFFDMLESLVAKGFQVDLEQAWKKDSDDES